MTNGVAEKLNLNELEFSFPESQIRELKNNGVIASNIIESSGTGIRVSGSEKVKLYNNTISRTYRPVYLFEDWRMNGCNAWNAAGVCTAKENWSVSQGLSLQLTFESHPGRIVPGRRCRRIPPLLRTGSTLFQSLHPALSGPHIRMIRAIFVFYLREPGAFRLQVRRQVHISARSFQGGNLLA